MVKRRFWSTFLLLLVALSASAAGEYELQRAKAAMNRGDYRGALMQFRNISSNSYFSSRVQREASYFVGFSCVKLSDPWSAIDAFERFLGRYQSSGTDWLIPDALYVLGRTYEGVSRIDDARRVYVRCRDRYSSSEFSGKSMDRLRIIGGGGFNPGPIHPPHPGPYHPPVGGYGITPEVADMIRLAKMDPSSYSADQMLLKAATMARTGPDFIAISRATQNQYTQWQVFSTAMQSRAFRLMTPYEVSDLVKTTNNSYYRNQVLLAYANNVARSAEDFGIIAEAAADSYTKSQILAIAREKLGNMNPHYRVNASVQYADQGPDAVKSAKGKSQTKPVPVEKAAPSDPFGAQFQINQEKVRRVNWFIQAVKSKKQIDVTAKQLTKDDMNLEIVREAIKSAEQTKKFDNLHQSK